MGRLCLCIVPESAASAAPQALAPMPPSWGMDRGALLQPRAYPVQCSATAEARQGGLGSVRALARAPLLSEAHVPHQRGPKVGP